MRKAGLDDTSPFGTYPARGWRRLVWRVCDWPALPASWRRRLRKRFARRITGPFDLVHDGIRYRLYPAENHCDRVLFARGRLPEASEHRALDPFLSRGMVFVDIGANIGSYSLYVMSRTQGTARIIALEPHPRTIRKLLFNLAANGFETGDVLQLASGPERATLELWSDGGSNIGHTSLLKAGTSNPKVSVEVDVVPLADILAERGVQRIGLLKIDVEGYEDRVLSPFLAAAPQSLWPRAVLIETAHRHLWQDDPVTLLEAAGYRTAFANAENLLLHHPGT